MATKSTFGNMLNQDIKGSRKSLPTASFVFKKVKPSKKILEKNPYKEVK